MSITQHRNRPGIITAIPPAILSFTVFLFTSCFQSAFLPQPESVAAPEVIELFNTGTFSYSVDPNGAARDVYFVFTNTEKYSPPSENPSVESNVAVDGKTIAAVTGQALFRGELLSENPALRRIDDMRRDPRAVLGNIEFSASGAPASGTSFPAAGLPGPSFDEAGATPSTGTMNDSAVEPYENPVSVPATCRYVSGFPVDTQYGARTLNIWVADDCWTGSLSNKMNKVDMGMVTALAERFLQPGDGNDIYDWVTGILGREWDDMAAGPDWITAGGEITILLCDIGADNSENGGIVGYFDPANQIKKTAGASSSNERVMFVLDAVMYASTIEASGAEDPSDTWDATDYWANEVFSTLAHEFQHMVHFYQKFFVQDSWYSDTWINEMCSQVMEDLVAERLGTPGPRGIDPADGTAGQPDNRNGRLPLFNKYTWGVFPFSWDSRYGDGTDSTVNYSIAYAFGAWLSRNYGGAELIRDIVQSPYYRENAVTDAVGKNGGPSTIEELLTRWAVAVIGSDRADMPSGYRYGQNGWFDSGVDQEDFRLGSINLYNYDYPVYAHDAYGNVILDADGYIVVDRMESGPFVFSASGTTPASTASVSMFSNIYYLAAKGLTNPETFSLTVPPGVFVSVYLKPSD